MTYELHPLCTLFPRMDGPAFESLKADIRANGLRQPIMLVDGLILDGGNRYRACLDAGVEPVFEEFSGDNLVSFVLSANLHRRHMTTGQQAAIVASATDWARANARGGDRKSNQTQLVKFDSVADRMAVSGASELTQIRADKLAREHPEIVKEVGRGEKSLYQAVKETSEPKPPAEKSSDPRDAQIAELTERLSEAHSNLAETIADNESMARSFEGDDKLGEALAEAKKWRAETMVLRQRVNGLMNEKNEAVRAAKSWQRKFEKLQKDPGRE